MKINRKFFILFCFFKHTHTQNNKYMVSRWYLSIHPLFYNAEFTKFTFTITNLKKTSRISTLIIVLVFYETPFYIQENFIKFQFRSSSKIISREAITEWLSNRGQEYASLQYKMCNHNNKPFHNSNRVLGLVRNKYGILTKAKYSNN